MRQIACDKRASFHLRSLNFEPIEFRLEHEIGVRVYRVWVGVARSSYSDVQFLDFHQLRCFEAYTYNLEIKLSKYLNLFLLCSHIPVNQVLSPARIGYTMVLVRFPYSAGLVRVGVGVDRCRHPATQCQHRDWVLLRTVSPTRPSDTEDNLQLRHQCAQEIRRNYVDGQVTTAAEFFLVKALGRASFCPLSRGVTRWLGYRRRLRQLEKRWCRQSDISRSFGDLYIPSRDKGQQFTGFLARTWDYLWQLSRPWSSSKETKNALQPPVTRLKRGLISNARIMQTPRTHERADKVL